MATASPIRGVVFDVGGVLVELGASRPGVNPLPGSVDAAARPALSRLPSIFGGAVGDRQPTGLVRCCRYCRISGKVRHGRDARAWHEVDQDLIDT